MTSRDLAIVVEANQLWIDYLDRLLDEPSLPIHDECVTVKAQGKTIKFQNTDNLADWLAENME
jgi:hypothetical protein